MAGLIDYSRFQEYQSPKKRNGWPIVLTSFFLLLIIIVIFKQIYVSKRAVREIITPLAVSVMEKGASILNPDVNSVAIEAIVQKELEGTKGNYGIFIKNLKTNERYYFNEHHPFESASLYKLFVLGTVSKKIEKGELNQKDILSQKIEILNKKFRIASESAELKEGQITIPIESALSRMITISDNYSALLLTEKVRLSQVAKFLTDVGLKESHMGTGGKSPTTTAADMGLFFDLLYRGELGNSDQTLMMTNYLKKQQLNGKIPKYLPQDVVIAHKTGELGSISHDAGIIYNPNGDYIIAVLTDTNSPVVANEKIAKISQKVYEYFIK